MRHPTWYPETGHPKASQTPYLKYRALPQSHVLQSGYFLHQPAVCQAVHMLPEA